MFLDYIIIKIYKMGAGVSTQPYKEILSILPNEDTAFTFNYSNGVFRLFRVLRDDTIEITITELELLDESLTFDSPPKIFIHDEKKYIDKRNDLINNTRNEFYVYKDSSDINLITHVSTNTRTGKFYEKLIETIAKNIGATGIYLNDTAKSSSSKTNCNDVPLSLKLFFSDKEQTYYESLGYRPSIKTKIVHQKLKAKNKLYTIGQYITQIDNMITHIKEDNVRDNVIQVLFICKYLFKDAIATDTDMNMTLFEYLYSLLSENKCKKFNMFLAVESFVRVNDKIIQNLCDILRELLMSSITKDTFYKSLK